MEIKMPKLDVTMTEGTFVGWLVPDGSAVVEGDDLYTVSTDKVEVDVPAPADGVVRHGDAEADETYPVGTTLGRLES